MTYTFPETPDGFPLRFHTALADASFHGEAILLGVPNESPERLRRAWRAFLDLARADDRYKLQELAVRWDFQVHPWEGTATGTQGLLLTRRTRMAELLAQQGPHPGPRGAWERENWEKKN